MMRLSLTRIFQVLDNAKGSALHDVLCKEPQGATRVCAVLHLSRVKVMAERA